MENLNIIIVGLGGIGNVVADNIYPLIRNSMNGYKLNSIVFVDHDTYSESNIPRQKAAASLLGMNKAVAWETIYSRSKANAVRARFTAVTEWITKDSVDNIIQPVLSTGTPTVIISCVDNHAARLVMSQYVQQMCNGHNNLVIIQAGCDRDIATADLYGKWNGIEVGVPIEKGHPEVLDSTEGDRGAMSCEELANLPSGDQTFTDNFMAGTMALNLLFTLMTENGPKVLHRFVGETMTCSTHYHYIEKKPIEGPVDVSAEEHQHQQQLNEWTVDKILTAIPDITENMAHRIIAVGDSNENVNRIVKFIRDMQKIGSVDLILMTSEHRQAYVGIITDFGSKGQPDTRKFDESELTYLIMAGRKNVTAGELSAIRRLISVTTLIRNN